MRQSLFLKLLLVATLALVLIMSVPAYHNKARRVLHGEQQILSKKNQLLGSLQSQVPTISVPDPPTAAGDAPPLLSRQLLRGIVAPSGPNPGTEMPNRTPPLLASMHKSLPHPSISNEDTSIP